MAAIETKPAAVSKPATDNSHLTLEQFLAQQREIDLLRFITCGSVDDGKSTLIGRLLHDTRQVFDDQLSAVANDSRRWGTTGEVPDLALLVDGLQAEREQGITIDVAYRYFQTPKRKFIVADCPGHEQYTRNMATGASTADAAVVLVDAEKGVRVQTRRHTHIVALLGVQNIIVAVNKMDRIDYDKAKFETIAAEVVTYARKLGVQNIEVIPVAALVGVNVVARGTAETPWYTGRTLLEALEGIEVGRNDGLKELRFPIQYVSRPDANFRGYAGTIASGEISVGDKVLALPSRKTSTVAEITTADGPLEKAGAAQAVTVVLADEIDLSRGDVLVHPDHRPTLARTFDAHILWMGEAPLLPGKRYEFKIGPRYVKGLVDSIQHRIDVNDLSTRETEALDLNGLARVRIALEEPVAIDDYKQSRATGSFIIVDLLHFGTVGAGMVIAPQAHAQKTSSDVVWQATRVTATVRANQKNQKPCVIWLTGLSGAGKSTIANGLEQVLVQRGHHSYLLDGDNVRHGLNRDLNFSEADRNENIRRIGEVAALFVDAGLIVVTAFISPFRADRDRIRERIGDAQFIEIYVSTPLVECEKRDPKGLYVKARAGQIREFTGIDSPYEPPLAPRLSIDTSKVPVTDAVDQIIHYLENKGFLHVVDPGL
ncbi:MAG TPA: sulfate adenylyltransferase subunit CysN [Steroidobacteraceae bacterium]|jgi:bifunctional enzyme CysN/CysC|nr:sulfate adenylyltransferase subunit CysN [Steroidobacteraceae bacterium]